MGRLVLCFLSGLCVLAINGQAAGITYYVSETGDHVAPYTNWVNAATNIEPALALAESGDSVILAEGRFSLNGPVVIEAGVELSSQNGPEATTVAILGGGVSLTGEQPVVSGVTFSGATNSRAITMGGNLALLDNCIVEHCGWGGILIDGATNAIVTNCTVTGNGPQSATPRHIHGGSGIAVVDSIDTLVIDTRISDNASTSSNCAGVSACSSTLVRDCEITGNLAMGTNALAGGMVLEASEAHGCQIYGNSSAFGAGGVRLTRDALLDRCHIRGNTAVGNGGGVQLGTNSVVQECLIVDNRAATGGGVWFVDAVNSQVRNCTIAENRAVDADTGGGLAGTAGPLVVVNAIIYYNDTASTSNEFSPAGATYIHSCAPGLSGSNNVPLPPAFKDLASNDYQLAYGSPCLDAGTNTVDMSLDLAGRAHTHDYDGDGSGIADIGCYEYSPYSVAVTIEGTPAAYGRPSLHNYGIWQITVGTDFTNQVDLYAGLEAGARAECRGWEVEDTLYGGTSNVAQFVVSNATTLTWIWTNQYRLVVDASTNGTGSPSGTNWYDAGTAVPIAATADQDFTFAGWGTSDAYGVIGRNSGNVLTMDSPRYRRAYFRADQMEQGIPVHWLRDHGLSIAPGTVFLDPDLDGYPTWMEYYVGLNPVEGDSDGDGLSDTDEVESYGSNPRDPRAPVQVDDDAVGDPVKNSPEGSDPEEDGSAQHPYDAIQEAVDAVAIITPSYETVVKQVGMAAAFQTILIASLDAGGPIEPGSVTIELAPTRTNGSSGTATDDGEGAISGRFNLVGPDDATSQSVTGTINYDTGSLVLNLTSPGLLAPCVWIVTYRALAHSSDLTGGSPTPEVVNNQYLGVAPTFQTILSMHLLASRPIVPNSVTLVLRSSVANGSSGSVTDDGTGILGGSVSLVGTDYSTAQPMTGTINYETGAVTLSLVSPGLLTKCPIYANYVMSDAALEEPTSIPTGSRQPLSQRAGALLGRLSSLSGVAISPRIIEEGSVRLIATRDGAFYGNVEDDGAGRLDGWIFSSGNVTGEIDYVTGEWSLNIPRVQTMDELELEQTFSYSIADLNESLRREPRSMVMVHEGRYSMPGNHSIAISNDVRILALGSPSSCVLQTDGVGPAFVLSSSNVTANTLLKGFRIEGGSQYGDQHGVIIRDGAAPVLEGLEIVDFSYAGVLCTNGAAPEVVDTSISGCGGGVLAFGSTPTVEKCALRANSALEGAGLQLIDGSSCEMENSLVVENSAVSGGGIMLDASSDLLLMNCVIASNSASLAGGGLASAGTARLRNSIVWANLAPTNSGIHRSAGTLDINYCDVQGGWAGLNIEADPLFSENDDYSLQAGSPAIDAGSLASAPATGLGGLSRPLDGDNDGHAGVDLGAYEFMHPQADSDLDRIPDWWELAYMGSATGLVGSADSDGDSASNAEEYIAGTDIHDRQSLLSISAAEGGINHVGMYGIEWLSTTGRLYAVFCSTNLASGWESLPAYQVLGDGYQQSYYTSNIVDCLFFSVRVEIAAE